jgi:putative nucleotidyltransferase with HDIG domain
MEVEPMIDWEELRKGVRESLPEIADIQDNNLRDKVIEAWALSLSHSEFTRIEDMSPAGVPGRQVMNRGTQADHLRGVARMALALADALEQVFGPLEINRDLLLAGALCHDLGKPFEFSERNQGRWSENAGVCGHPSLRHPVYGAHIALTAGLPEAIAHICAAHSLEGQFVKRSLENTIVHHCDYAYWDVLERAGIVTPDA